jgi:hypothetical protein
MDTHVRMITPRTDISLLFLSELRYSNKMKDPKIPYLYVISRIYYLMST